MLTHLYILFIFPFRIWTIVYKLFKYFMFFDTTQIDSNPTLEQDGPIEENVTIEESPIEEEVLILRKRESKKSL